MSIMNPDQLWKQHMHRLPKEEREQEAMQLLRTGSPARIAWLVREYGKQGEMDFGRFLLIDTAQIPARNIDVVLSTKPDLCRDPVYEGKLLHRVASCGQLQTLKVLAEKFDIDVAQRDVWVQAARNGHAGMIDWLAQKKHMPDDNAIRVAYVRAAETEHLSCLKSIATARPDVIRDDEIGDAIVHAAAYGAEKSLKFLLQQPVTQKQGHYQFCLDKALFTAAQFDFGQGVTPLLAAGANPRYRDSLCLRAAAYKGRVDIARKLVQAGADIHASGNEALIVAAQNGHANVARYLLQQGANVHAQKNKALVTAFERRHADVMDVLLENNADIMALEPHKGSRVSRAVWSVLSKHQDRLEDICRANLVQAYGKDYTLEDMRHSHPHLGCSGIAYAASAGVFQLATEHIVKNPHHRFLTQDDLRLKTAMGDTVLKTLIKQRKSHQILNPLYWRRGIKDVLPLMEQTAAHYGQQHLIDDFKRRVQRHQLRRPVRKPPFKFGRG